MLIFNNDQLVGLASNNRENFISNLSEILRDELDEIKKMDVDELRNDIIKQIKKANFYGFTLNSTVASYVISAFLMGENFDIDFKAASDILHKSIKQNEKIRRLEDWVHTIFSAFENN
jgi:hypothetical protein